MLPTLEYGRVVLAGDAALALVLPHTALPREESLRAVRSTVQELLATLVGVPAGELVLRRSSAGKPAVAGHALAFNLSHASGASLLALSLVGDVGCDIEDRLRPDDANALAPVLLHPAERGWLATLPGAAREAGFAHCWVRKEAVLKAQRTGFSVEPRAIDVQPASARPMVDGLHLHDAPEAGSFAAAVACREATCCWFALR
jgi:4'-phosphopantetheinyl transferase